MNKQRHTHKQKLSAAKQVWSFFFFWIIKESGERKSVHYRQKWWFTYYTSIYLNYERIMRRKRKQAEHSNGGGGGGRSPMELADVVAVVADVRIVWSRASVMRLLMTVRLLTCAIEQPETYNKSRWDERMRWELQHGGQQRAVWLPAFWLLASVGREKKRTNSEQGR